MSDFMFYYPTHPIQIIENVQKRISNSDVDTDGAETKVVAVGKFRRPRRSALSHIVQVGFRHDFLVSAREYDTSPLTFWATIKLIPR